MPNDSSTGGYLTPTSTAPINDVALNTTIQAAISGITGLAGANVIRIWQQTPPVRPAIGTDWIAYGTAGRKRDFDPFIQHSGTDNGGKGDDTLIRSEEIDVQVTVYGPNAEGNATLLEDGLTVPQNLEALGAAGLFLIETGDPVKAADLINNQWWPRVDLTLRFRRMVNRTYPVLNILEAPFSLEADASSELTETGTAGPNPPP